MSTLAGTRLLDRLHHLEHHWYRRDALTASLLPLSWVFCLAARLRRTYHRSYNRLRPRLPVPVIVVGNISVGGTGKTPLVIWLATVLEDNGYRPGVISRGYGGRASVWPQLVTSDSDPALVGDEPILIARRTRCPIAVAPRRNAAARALLEAHGCDVLISDDGLQHYGLLRDIEIAVIAGERGLGNGWCLPAGPLREPPSRLREVDFVVTQGRVLDGSLVMRLHGEQALNLLDPCVVQPLEAFAGRRIHAVAGIGNPKRFFDDLARIGLELNAHPFPDHHRFTAADLEFGDEHPVLMTEKDAVKCRAFAKAHHWYVPVTAQPDERLAQGLLARLRYCDTAWSGDKQTMETSRGG